MGHNLQLVLAMWIILIQLLKMSSFLITLKSQGKNGKYMSSFAKHNDKTLNSVDLDVWLLFP